DILLFANLGAIQLNYGYTLDSCKRAIEMIEADALVLHLNPLQEALQPEGNTQFKGLLNKIEHICKHLNAPVVVKEVGWGISAETAQRLQNAGVSAIDVAGAGGTSWSQVEMFRNQDLFMAETCGDFRDWGINTVESINNIKRFAPEMTIIASGGLKNGIDICKTLALGAILGGMASVFLKAATTEDETILLKTIQKVSQEIKICLFASGVKCLREINSSILKQ
ncbi:MAG: alpha-hydroxy-acid oxidizing protein, partial [Anaerolineaceae bacterium]|nr:alpha-hydroxy-acid oxidizing protein [Anaerolineaceae bacterium]